MALLLPKCAPPESLHQQLTVRQRLSLRRSRKPARATHGAAESSSSSSSSSTKKAATDRYRIAAGTEPCCNITSPLLMTPRISVRRSSRLRVRKGRWDDAKTDTDMDSAEWINRMLDKNGVVEVDPVTIAKQMRQEQLYHTNSPNNTTNSHYHAANYVSSADASHINPPRGSGFPSKVPLAVALAAGSAVALAAVAFLLKSLNKQGDETASTSSDSKGSNLSSSFKGEPVAPDSSSKGSHSPPQGTRGNKEALASTAATAAAAARAAILQPGNVKEGSSTPSPPSVSKTGSQGEKSQSPTKDASVTPFFTSAKSSVPDFKPAPPVSRWGEDKFKTIQPFFADDRAAVAPSIPEEQSTTKQSENSSSPSKTVTPFFTSHTSVSDPKPAPPVSRWGEDKFKSVQPFFADEKQGITTESEKSPSPSKTVTPLKSESSPSPSKTVTPFFTSARSSVSDSKPAPPVSRWGEEKFKAIQPFFADDRAAVAPSIPEEQSTTKKSESSPSPSKTVTPFFTSARSSVSDSKPAPPVSRWGEDKFQAVQPFFADEQQSSTKKSEKSPSPSKTGTPLESEKSPSPSKTITPSKSESSPSPSKTVTPFFSSARSSVSDSKPAPPVSRWGEDKFNSVQPFFPDEQQSRTRKSESSPSPSKIITPSKSESSPSPSKTVTPFFTSARSSVSDSKPAPPVSRWGEDKFKTIQPFFADDKAAVAPLIPEEQSTTKQSEKSPSPSKTVTPFFADEEQGSKDAKESVSVESVAPFFAVNEQQQSSNGPSVKTATPFFADEQQTNGSSLENVIPFFADEQQQAPGVSQSKGPLDLENVKPFFSDDDQVGRPSLAASLESLKPTRIPEDEMAGKPQDQHQEFLNPEEFAVLEETKAEEERQLAKMQALQAAFPALAIGAGAVGALAGVDGALEMVGVTATASFISYELLWANKRNELLDEISRITDHHQLFRFLQKRKVLKDDC